MNVNVNSTFNHPKIDFSVNLTTVLTNSTSVLASVLAYTISVSKQKMSTIRE